jgi:ribosomal protein L33
MGKKKNKGNSEGRLERKKFSCGHSCYTIKKYCVKCGGN